MGIILKQSVLGGQKEPGPQLWKNSSLVKISVKSLINMEVVQNGHVTCEVTLEDFGVKIGWK